MKVTTKQHEVSPDGIPERQTITVEIESGDDPAGYLNGLIIDGTLATFLRVYGAADLQPLADDPDLHNLLVRFGKVANRTEIKFDQLMTATREGAGYSWRQIANAVEMHQSTVRNRVRKELEHARIRHLTQQLIDGYPDGIDFNAHAVATELVQKYGLIDLDALGDNQKAYGAYWPLIVKHTT
ncbi:MAG: hypothetical protein ACRDP6_29285 [Actinoallomurus sp.]